MRRTATVFFALVRLLAWPWIARRPWRVALAFSGVALAAGVYAGMHLANQAVKEAFLRATDRLAGSAQLHVVGSVQEEALDLARGVECVEAAAGLIVRVVSTGLSSDAGLAILGIDLLDEPRFREYRMEGQPSAGLEDALVFLAQPDSVLVTRQFAERHGLGTGSALPIWTGRERRVLRVRGLLASAGAASAYGGNVAVMDVYAAQHMLGRRGFFDRIDLGVRPGEDAGGCRERVARAVGPHLKVEMRGGRVEELSATYLLLVESSGLLAALIAMFLVHHAATVAVAQREREIAILLGLGARARDIAGVILMESAVLGALGAGCGIGIGVFSAGRLAGALGRLASGWGVSLEIERAPVDAAWAVATVLVCAAFCAVSAFGAARNAAGTPPIQLAEARRYSSLVETGGRRAALLAALCAAAAVAWQCWDRRPNVLYATLPLFAAALALLARALTAGAFRVVRPWLIHAWPLEGQLAADAFLRTNRRTRGALVGLSLTAATVLAVSSLTAAYAEAFRTWTRQVINGDFLVHSARNIAGSGELFPASLGERLNRAPGVADAVPLRRFDGEADSRRVRLMATDMRAWARHVRLPVAADGAAISRIFANRSGRRAGDRVRITAPDGYLDLPVIAVIDDYTSELGAIYFDWQIYRKRFHDDAVELFSVYLAPGAARPAVRRALAERLDPAAPAMILDGDEFRAQLDGIVARWRGIGFVQVAAAALLSLIGVVSFLTVSISERRREMGLLGLLGATPAQVRRCILVESLGIAAAGLLLGAVLGTLLDGYLLFTLRYSVNGFELPWRIDWPVAAALLVAWPAGALAAGILPARSVQKMDLAREVESDA